MYKEGRLEVRALSWEDSERQTSFEVRGWLRASVQVERICLEDSQHPSFAEGSSDEPDQCINSGPNA